MKTMQVSALKYAKTGELAAPSANPYVRLLSLKCNVTEDSGEDECYLIVRVRTPTGASDYKPSKTMRPGDVWNLSSTSYPLRHGDCIVWLYDEDGPFDGDDYLGSVQISGLLEPGDYFADFTHDDANYRLDLRIE